MTPKKALSRRLELLESHLRSEHPTLLPVIPTYRAFDRLLYRMGLLEESDSLATRIPWWPMISLLGLFSSGKSSFINSYLGQTLQTTGNQAVDDKFTVICFGPDRKYDSLPGTALNADPRFPFYRVSDEIEKVAAGEGKRIDSYLQLKTCSSPKLRGKILIDSPGFDADDQRRSTLRVTDHIIDLSDLVLVFFDARRPEPGAMGDTLDHLVAKTIRRSDARKFLFILNQIDASAREDNPEEVVGAWQRAISQAGLVSGRFYGVYNRDVAPPIEDPIKRARYEAKNAADLSEIHARIDEIEVGRGYRIASLLEALAKELETEVVPTLTGLRRRWSRWVLGLDVAWAVLLAGAIAGAAYAVGADTLNGWAEWMVGPDQARVWDVPVPVLVAGGALLALLVGGHFLFRGLVSKRMAARLPERMFSLDLSLRNAFRVNTSGLASVLRSRPVGWSGSTRRQLFVLREAIARHVQRWNDAYTDPAGRNTPVDAVAPPQSVNQG